MSRYKKPSSENTSTRIEEGLNGLLGALGDAIGDVVSGLEEGNAGAVMRDQVFETSKGPVRAHAGVRLRMGGLNTEGVTADTPQPVNPDRAKPTKAEVDSRSLPYEIFEDDADWILTADMPGVKRTDLELSQNDSTLIIKTTGPRRYDVQVALDAPLNLTDIKIRLRNGILTLHVKKVNPA